MSKIMERVVANQLVEFIEDNFMFNKFQSGFRRVHGIETALVRVMNDVYKARDSGYCVAIALLDISAAFDTLDHFLLLEIMSNHLGIGGMVLEWFRNYLSNRQQHVKINNSKSDPLIIKHGVPQGSILGPILFSVYLIPLYI